MQQNLKTFLSTNLTDDQICEIFDKLQIGIAFVDADEVILWTNQKFCDMLMYSKNDLIGKTFKTITHPVDYEIDKQNFEVMKDVDSINAYSMVKRYIRADGRVLEARLFVDDFVSKSGIAGKWFCFAQVKELETATKPDNSEEQIKSLSIHQDQMEKDNKKGFMVWVKSNLPWIVGSFAALTVWFFNEAYDYRDMKERDRQQTEDIEANAQKLLRIEDLLKDMNEKLDDRE